MLDGSALDRQARGAGHRGRQRLGAAHAAEAGGQYPPAGEIAAIMLASHLDEGFVSALHDALRADIDPRARGHLAVHHQALAVEFVEMIPGRPMRHQVGVGDQHARGVDVGAEHAHRLARLHQQRLVGFEAAERRNDAVEGLPVARRAANAPVNDQLARPFGDIRIEIVHQHAQRRLGQPALGGAFDAARGADDAHIVDAVVSGHGGPPFRVRSAVSRRSGRGSFQECGEASRASRSRAVRQSAPASFRRSGAPVRAYRRGRRAPFAAPRFRRADCRRRA